MTPEQVALVQSTVRQVAPRLDDVAADFYARLLTEDPALSELFPGDPAEQQGKFAAELEGICLAVRDHTAFLARTAGLGALHRDRGVRARHYATAGPALLAALAAALGTSWTPPVAEAWRLAYHLTAEAMMGAPHPS